MDYSLILNIVICCYLILLIYENVFILNFLMSQTHFLSLSPTFYVLLLLNFIVFEYHLMQNIGLKKNLISFSQVIINFNMTKMLQIFNHFMKIFYNNYLELFFS